MRLKQSIYLSVVIGCIVACFSNTAISQVNYPTRPIKIIVGYAPGGATDIIARIIAERFTASMGQPVFVENIPGAGGNLGAAAVARAAPDGYTLQLGTMGNMTINPSVYKNMPINTVKDFQPISNIAIVPNIMVVNPSVPVKNVKEFVAWAKARPGQVFFASSGTGNSPHMTGELFNIATGLNMTHVPYKGSGPALTDLISGQGVQVTFDNMPAAINFVRNGNLRALAVTSANRAATEPGLPTIKESGYPDFVVEAWFGLFAPAGTPRPIVDKLNAEVAIALKNPDIQKRLLELGAQPAWTSPEDYQKLLESDIKKWADVAKKAKIEGQ
ncbi:tripartite tricarboxylate transporter substrate binding protein [Polynucleobacter sp. 71A-WALBACH]|uniref:Bug family tripartite tricarboxylate transporter substrate binding protein n=1 Tax=Polynucleobacter sp. 71A-WALBACH TaxID=2689097 RepID=UPI001C0D5A09|nr:tripartite tricarboxylate transporter substrate binding protein [Polynucleobacter sp. 71A-WALBACH]MBU3593422.1 tripartite tricarboxylate transporter substrate binding protein [Polynucleobacter sp. 71A-WALBACH]